MLGAAGVEAVGLNFFEQSKRYVHPSVALEITQQLPKRVKRVGLFVNASSDTIRKTADAVPLDLIQLHGDEPPNFLSELDGLKIIRAFRCRAGLAPVETYLAECKHQPVAVLVDAYDPTQFGGTGKTLNWPDLANARKYIGDLPLILAGGLTPANVRQAIQQAGPYGVDTASGVEVKSTPGRKDRDLSHAFVRTAKSAFPTNS